MRLSYPRVFARPWFCSLLLLSVSPLIAAEPRVGASDGHLAIAAEDADDWSLLATGDLLPDSARFRTSGAGVVAITTGASTLTIGPETSGRWDHRQQSIALDRGRLLIAAGSDEQWSVSAASVRLQLAPGASVSIAVDSSRVACDVLHGYVQVAGDAIEARTAAAPASVAIRNTEVQIAPQPDADWPATAAAWADSQPRQGPGQLVASGPQTGTADRLKIARYHVNVVLQPPVALVQIDQSFYNPNDWFRAEGTFVFNLPPGASVSRFAMFVTHEDLIEGELIERQRADNVYTRIVTGRRDPAILEQIGDNLFRMRVFPILAKDAKRILLDYTVPLTAEHGRYTFQLPLMSDLDPIWDLRLAGTIHPPFDAPTITSPSHPDLAFTKSEDGSVRFQLQQQYVQPPPTLRLDYRAPTDQTPHIRSFSASSPTTDLRRRHFVITFPPLETIRPEVQRSPLDVQIIADTSSSTSEFRLLRESVRTIVAGLDDEDRFQLGCVDLKYRPLTSDWVAPRSDVADEALAAMDAQVPLGSSALWRTLTSILNSPPENRDGRRRIVVYVGDGVATDETPPVSIRTDLPTLTAPEVSKPADGALFVAIQIGEAPATERLLQRIVDVTGGRLFWAGRATAELGKVYQWLLEGAPAPRRIEQVAITDRNGVAASEVFFPSTWPDGQTLDVTGRTVPDGNLNVLLKLTDESEPRQYDLALPVEESDNDLFAGRFWAQQKLNRLLQDAATASTIPAELKKKIVELAQEWSLICPYTAFLVLEKESDYARWQINRTTRFRYWKPAGAVTAIPLPPELRPGPKTVLEPPSKPALERTGDNQPPDAQRFETALMAAEAAISRQEAARALVELVQVQPLARALGAERFESLWSQAQIGLARNQFLEGLALQRPLLDRRTLPALPTIDPLMVSLQFGGISPEYEQIFPHAARLARRVTPPGGKVTLADLAAFVSAETGVNVILDQPALSEEGITGKELVDLNGIREITLHSLLDLALEDVNQVELAYTTDTRLIRITTRDEADNTLTTMIYPVADVVRTNVLPSPARLSDPFVDLDRAMSERVGAKLAQPVSVEFKDAPLVDAMAWLRDFLGESVRLNRPTLSEEGITGDEKVTLKLNNVPAKAVLEEILRDVNQVELDYDIHDEVLIITTKDDSDNTLQTRLYSLAGILYEIPKELLPRRHKPGFFQGSGFGGGLGGGGFGGGGFGGGGLGGGMPEVGAVSPLGTDPVTGRSIDVAASDGSAGDASVSAVGAPSYAEFPEASDGVSVVPDADTPVEAIVQPEVSSADELPTESLLLQNPASMGPDYDEPIDAILETTEGPWESIDGIGGSDPREYPQSLSLVIRQTRRVHVEVSDLLDRLRKLPPAGPLVRRAQIPHITENLPAGWDMDAVIDLILEETKGPWESIDGIGGPDPSEHFPSMSLIIRQTHQMHEEIYSLLAMLRRSRVMAGRHSSSTRLSSADELARMRDNLSLTDLPTLPRRDGLPLPDEDELKLLERAHRRVATGRQVWQHQIGKGKATTLTLTAGDPRLQLELANHILRADGDNAAVAYPGITLVELGPWGESIRRIADARFPWLPHRTNGELSQMFDISVEQEAADGLTLRLGFPGAREAWLLLQFDLSGQVRRAEAWLDAARQYEVQFEFDPARPGAPARAAARNADGLSVEQWLCNGVDANATIPAPADDWGDFIVDDPAVDQTPYRRTRDALAHYDYAGAAKILSDALVDRPQQPLLNLLLAWIDEFGGHPEAVHINQHEALAKVAGSGAFDLARMISSLNFPSISDRELYDLLLLVPDDRRSAANYDELALLAAELDRPLEALAHVDAALTLTPGDAPGERRVRKLDRIAALLRLGRTDEAVRVSADLLEPRANVDDLIQIGDRFGSAGQTKLADDYFARAREAIGDDRFAQAELLKREARWHTGARRWQILLRAASLNLEDRKRFDALLKIVLEEMTTPDDAVIAGMFVTEFADSPAVVPLRIREAELTTVPSHAADIAVQLYNSKELPSDRFVWMIGMATNGSRDADAITILEDRLRRGVRLNDLLRQYLASAYRQADRKADADRAESDFSEPRHEAATPTSNPGPQGGGFFSPR